ncbi:hypothetical protein Syun_003961 [Stephania yunnanensis]|uniref:Uncharacterized protein n=1 Tax=Stephania yunnanensis TaxID=152371 RepID=A0AAP0Q236_9MAGN
MAALQQYPVAFQAKSPPSARLSSTMLTHRAIRLSFSATFPSLNLSGKTSKPKRRGGTAAGATMVDSAAESYASALAEVAESNKTLHQTFEDVEKLVQIFSYPKVYDFFVDPTIDTDQKAKLIDDISKSSNLQPHTTNFLNILVDSKRIEIFNEMAKEFEVAYNKLTETELAVVTSVVKLESQHLAQIAKGVQRLTGAKNVRIKTAIDPSLVAGFTIRYGSSGSKLIDMSVKKQLAEIATQLDFSDLSLAV